MVTLRDGTVVDESVDAVHLTRAADVPSVFKQGPRVETSITIHWWGRDANGHPYTRDTYDMNMNYLASDNTRSSSAHYTAMAKQVNCLVSPDDAAWHAGSAIGNTTSIGIECCPEGYDGDYETIAALIAYIRSIYGDIPLVPHNHWVGTECPGNYDLARLDQLARNTGEIMATADEVVDALLNRTITGTDGKPVEILWILQSFHAIMTDQVNNTAAAVKAALAGSSISSGGSVDINAISKAVVDEVAKRLSNG